MKKTFNDYKWETAVPKAKARAIAAEMTNAANVKDNKNIKPGDRLYLYTDCNIWTVRMVHNPYTVTEVKGNIAKIREAKLVFNGVRYFDTLPDEIVPDPYGKERELRWNAKKNRWQVTPIECDPEVAVFGRYDYQPYLD